MDDNIKVQVNVQSGDSFEIDTASDIRAEEFVRQLVSELQLPATDREGRPISYQLHNRDTGKVIDAALTLAQNGVTNGHQLSLTQTVIAGGLGRR